MVFQINDPYTGNIAGRIGKGFAQGLAEQLPKEVKQGRMSYALEELKKNNNLTPLDQAQKLLRGGFSPEDLQQFLPLIQQAQERRALEEDVKRQRQEEKEKITGNVGTEIPPNVNEPTKALGAEGEAAGEIPLSQQIRGENFLEPMTPQQRDRKVGELIARGRFFDRTKAEE